MTAFYLKIADRLIAYLCTRKVEVLSKYCDFGKINSLIGSPGPFPKVLIVHAETGDKSRDWHNK